MTDEASSLSDRSQEPEAQDALSFVLPPSMTIETAEAVAAVFKELPIGGGVNVVFDASNVETITTPGLQVLVSLKIAVVGQGGSLRVKNAPPAFSGALADTGLRDIFQ